MKLLIQIVLVALIVGGASAGGSFYWHLTHPKPLAAAEEPAEESDDAAKDDSAMPDIPDTLADEDPHAPPEATPEEEVKTALTEPQFELGERPNEPKSFGPPVGVRPPWDRNGDEAGELINSLRNRAATTSRRERRIAEREEVMNMIFDDLRFEQVNSAKLRRRILEETNQAFNKAEAARRATAAERAAIYRATEAERAKIRQEQLDERRMADEQIQDVVREKEAAIEAADAAMRAIREEQEELKRQLEDARKPPEVVDKSGSENETVNLKKLITLYDAMPADGVVSSLKQSVDKGQIDAAIAILDGMKPKKTAEVLMRMQESQPTLVADLLERLRRFKKGSPSGSNAN